MATRKKVSLDPNFRDFIESMNSQGVRFLLLGGYAVNFHGYHRFTADIDFWIAIDAANAERVAAALRSFGFSDNATRPESFMVPGKVHMFGRPPVRIDLLTGPSGVEFEACYARRVTATLDGVEVPVIGLADLRANKAASGRDKDLIDLKKLPPA